MTHYILKRDRYPLEGNLHPIAIFCRPLEYVSAELDTAEDDLDEYQYVTYSIGNRYKFDLRRYRGDERWLFSIYISVEVTDPTEVEYLVSDVSAGLEIPRRALAWRLGIDFEYGKLERPKKDNLTESEARVIALKAAALSKDHCISTERIKELTPTFYELTSEDLKPSKTRPREAVWRQRVGNVVSHQNSNSSIFRKGYAERTSNGICLTNHGLTYLKSIGFISFLVFADL